MGAVDQLGVDVVVVPFPAQGHLNQLLHLSLLLSSRGAGLLRVHYVSSPAHIRQAKNRIHGWDAASLERIHFQELSIPPFASPPPDPDSPDKFPFHLWPAFEASEGLRAPLTSLLLSLSASSRRIVLVHEHLMSFAAHDAAALPNAEIFGFHCVPASFQLHYLYKEEAAVKPEVLDVILAPFPGCLPSEFWDFAQRRSGNRTYPEVGTLINTSRAIEGEFVDLLGKQPEYNGKEIYAVGPLNPVVVPGSGPRHECLEWLDRQPPASVVHVSFGSTLTLSDQQIEQLAIGLQRSGQRFIWVLREADRADVFAADDDSCRQLPDRYQRMVEGLGMVVRGWAPQLEILAHESTGGFVSHCGWNSCMESLSMGVPMVAWPMHSDQPSNAKMVTEHLKVGVAMREWDRREEVVSASEIEEAVRRVMVGEEGKEMRRRAAELGEAVQKSVSEGGSSRADLTSFIAHITR